MAFDSRQARKLIGDNYDFKMATTVPCAGVASMQMALVFNQQVIWRERVG